ncbi:hypothetical protein LA080_004005 [Diaporthe eres]|nr:hypothetical protein LA080_004005 [Diaporthe eres]
MNLPSTKPLTNAIAFDLRPTDPLSDTKPATVIPILFIDVEYVKMVRMADFQSSYGLAGFLDDGVPCFGFADKVVLGGCGA